ncbi:unnamed protein product [Adineta steineri]|uniref:NHL repeat containing protein n=1 Tax=Adineta steineri TaxID=433720 RepID=A0A814UXN3_9BILA|nr:unnamed protein product [Adineta steineri]
MLKSTMHHVKSVIYPQSASPQSMLGKLPKPKYQNMESKRPLINRNEEEDIELATKRTAPYDLSPQCKVSGIAFRGAGLVLALHYRNAKLAPLSESENIHSIKQSTRPQRRSMTVIIKSQICEKTPQYGECSTNSACGCFHMIGTNDDVGVCGFLWPTCSRLVRCNSSDYSCLQPNTICVQHPQCDDFPLCYPVGMIDQNMCPPTKNKSNLKWKQNAITVAGGNGRGQQLNQKHNAKEGQVIAGGNGQGKRIDQLSSPMAMILDQQNHSLIITDQGNWRVIQWSSQKQQILIDNIFCYNLAMDKYGFLYVSNWNVGEVRRWKMGEYKNEGIVVAGGNGKGNQLNQLNHPTFIFVDKDQSVYVTDYNNGRVMKWKKDAKEGIVVAGGNGGGGNLNQLLYPHGVIVDHLGQVYVVDKGNNRVMRWCEGKEYGEIVVGGNGQGGESDQLSDPTGLSFDDEENLYVA